MNKINNLSAWLGIIGFIISIVIFFSAKPYFQDWIKKKGNTANTSDTNKSILGHNKQKISIVNDSVPRDVKAAIVDFVSSFYNTRNKKKYEFLHNYFQPLLDNNVGKRFVSSADVVDSITRCDSALRSKYEEAIFKIDSSSFFVYKDPVSINGYRVKYTEIHDYLIRKLNKRSQIPYCYREICISKEFKITSISQPLNLS